MSNAVADQEVAIRSPARLTSTLAALSILVTVLALLGIPLGAAHAAETGRIWGQSRIDTAAEVALANFPDGADHVILVRGGWWPDALSSAAFSGALDAPVLLTHRDHLSERTDRTLEELGTTRVTIVGGPGAVQPQVEAELERQGYEVTRVFGRTRFDTAAEVARRLSERIGSVDGQRAVFIAFGGDFPDALAVGPGAHRAVIPVLLTERDELHPATAQAMEDVNAEVAVIVGGTGVVQPSVERDIERRGVATRRVSGQTRFATAQAVGRFLRRQLGFATRHAVLVRGDIFPDALAAAPYAGDHQAPILLTEGPAESSYDELQFLVDHAEGIDRVVAIGGPGAVRDAILQRAAVAAEPPEVTYTYTTGVRDDNGPVRSSLGFFSEHADWTLTDRRGWSLANDIRFTRVPRDSDADFHLWLASPEDVEAASPGCSDEWSCRVGHDVYINDERWRETTATYDHRPRDDYRHYVVLHEIGHWLGLDHLECSDSPSDEAPVMQQQSIALDGCVTNVWPLPFERDEVRDRHLSGASTSGSDSEVDQE